MKVVLDTNFLMVPGQFKVDILSEISRLLDVNYQLYVPEQVREELRELRRKGGLKERKAAEIALKIAGSMKTLRTSGATADEAISKLLGKGTVVCTNDRRLRELALKKGGKVIFLRQKSHLELEGGEIGVSEAEVE